jgi:hypothetical protein
MLTAEARVETDRASRYLIQACQHFSNQGRHLRGPAAHRMGAAAARHMGAGWGQAESGVQARVEWSETDGTVDFGWARCTLQATAAALMLRAEAADQENLQRVQGTVADHLERFGRRDHLTVTWRQTS